MVPVASAMLGLACGLQAQSPATPPASQNPSPMVERTRAHQRLPQAEAPGIRRTFTGPLGKPVAVFIPRGTKAGRDVQLVVHFHGAAFVAEQAVAGLGTQYVLAVVNVGAGSGSYDRAFSDPPMFDSLRSAVQREIVTALGSAVVIRGITLAGFSAGHGAIRAILRDSAHFAQVNAVLLLDGMHTSYVPDGTVLEKGGQLDERNLDALERFARAALRKEKRLVITHSEIFPGTFASTTETADYLLNKLELRRVPVLKWGPGGMQQLSEARRAGVEIIGFAGNTAPDHIDHLHGMPEFLKRLAARRR